MVLIDAIRAPIECCSLIFWSVLLWLALLVVVKITGYHYGVYTMSEATMQLYWADILWATALLISLWLFAGLVIMIAKWAGGGSGRDPSHQRVIYVTKEEAQKMGLPYVNVFEKSST